MKISTEFKMTKEIKKTAKAKPIKCKWTRWLLITPLKIIVGFYLFLYLFATVKPWLPGLGYTESMELVDVQISSGYYEKQPSWMGEWLGGKVTVFVPYPENEKKRMKMRIPKSYLTPAHRKGGVDEYIELEATYPDLKPWGAEYLKKPFLLDEQNQKVYIKMSTIYSQYRMPNFDKHKDIFLGQYKGLLYGLDYYKEKLAYDNKGNSVQGFEQEYFFSSEPKLKIRCHVISKDEDFDCRAGEILEESEFYIEYTFLRRELKNWQQIDQNIKNLIQSFIVKE